MKLRMAATALCLAFVPTSAMANDDPELAMWRLDCGSLELSDTAPFSDANLYDGQTRTLTSSCYLIRHGDKYLLWDTGLAAALKENSATQWVFTLSLEKTIVEQLTELDLTADDVDMVGISHYHDDHTGQAGAFPSATLLINQADYDVATSGENTGAAASLAPWIGEEKGETKLFSSDLDVFGDGSVIIKAMPGHTPGHSSLLVRLPGSGNFLLSGDLYHFEEQVENRGVPTFNTDRADTLASFERFNQIAKSLDATVIIQHDPRHIGRLPSFPKAAE